MGHQTFCWTTAPIWCRCNCQRASTPRSEQHGDFGAGDLESTRKWMPTRYGLFGCDKRQFLLHGGILRMHPVFCAIQRDRLSTMWVSISTRLLQKAANITRRASLVQHRIASRLDRDRRYCRLWPKVVYVSCESVKAVKTWIPRYVSEVEPLQLTQAMCMWPISLPSVGSMLCDSFVGSTYTRRLSLRSNNKF